MTSGSQQTSGQSRLEVRRRTAWLVSLPILAVGSLIAHELAYRIVAGAQADALLARTGHGYLDALPEGSVLGAVCLAFGLLLAGIERQRGLHGSGVPAWLIALVPLLGFALQEHLERLVHTGSLPVGAALEPTFAVGLLLQLPFAALAFLLARLLLRMVVRLVGGVDLRPRRRGGTPTWRVTTRMDWSDGSPLAERAAPRGPPSLRVA